MNISDILSPECVFPGMDCHSKKDALDTLAKTIANSDHSTSQTEVFECLIARERLGSTGLGNGIAIPHGRLKNGKKTLAAFIQLESAIDYDAVDNAPVDLLFALIFCLSANLTLRSFFLVLLALTTRFSGFLKLIA